MSEHDEPLVAVGMPVRNPGAKLVPALESVQRQTHRNLRIIISDNGSTDDTEQLVRAAARADPRVVYVRQDPPVTVWQNFRTTFELGRAAWFLWAADDDLRSLDYVERLLAAVRADDGAVLAFGDLRRFDAPGAEPVPVIHRCDTAGLTPAARVRRAVLSPCAEVYGLLRTEALSGFDWPDLDFAPDVPLLIHLSSIGEIVQVSGPTFDQHVPASGKTPAERALANSFRRVGRMHILRLSMAAARAAAGPGAPHRLPGPVAFAVAYGALRWTVTKTWLFEHSPDALTRAWQRVKALRRRPRAEGTARAS